MRRYNPTNMVHCLYTRKIHSWLVVSFVVITVLWKLSSFINDVDFNLKTSSTTSKQSQNSGHSIKSQPEAEATIFRNQDSVNDEMECAIPHKDPDGGDCQSMGGQLLRPKWACFSEMRDALPAFIRLYQQRPIPNNQGGMRFDHSFALYYILTHLRPKPDTVIESGAFKGHSTWLIQQALPAARIFSLDPNPPRNRLTGVKYMVGKDWVDLAKVDWAKEGVDPTTSVIFIDDHQSAYRRIFLEMRLKGFTRYMIEDNYPFLHGDNMSFKWVCELKRQSEWPEVVSDNFNREKIPVTWDQHLKHARYLPKVLRIYYEFPPVASTELSGQTRFNPLESSTPIVSDRAFFEESGLSSLDLGELSGYTHFVYVEINMIDESPPLFS